MLVLYQQELPTLKLKGKKNKIRSFAPIGLKETTSKKRDEPRECLDCREEVCVCDVM